MTTLLVLALVRCLGQEISFSALKNCLFRTNNFLLRTNNCLFSTNFIESEFSKSSHFRCSRKISHNYTLIKNKR